MRRTALVITALAFVLALGEDAPAEPPEATEKGAHAVSVENEVIGASWRFGGEHPTCDIHDRRRQKAWSLGTELFHLELGEAGTLRASDCTVEEAHGEGGVWTAAFEDPEKRVSVRWRVELPEQAHYVRQRVTVTALEKPVTVKEIRLFDLRIPEAKRIGSVPGSVVVLPGLFLAAEHPMADNDAGFPMTRVGTWSPETVTWPERSSMRWDVTKALHTAGPLEVLFQYTKGGHRLEVHGAKLLQDGEAIAEDRHFGATGSRDVENRFRFRLKEHDPEATYEIEIQGLSDGGTDSHGWVGLALTDGPPRVLATLTTETELGPRQSTSLGSVVGVYPEGQLRRSFLRYIEKERAHPYRPFLHYNSWYDIGYFSKYDEAACLDVVRRYGEELVKKRGVTIDSFLFDDGWDDTSSLWDFHDGLPNGFRKVKELAESYDTAPGVWLSPWGGYGEPRKQRLAAGKAAGYEQTKAGFVLSGPRYYERFRDICVEMVREHGVNQFKFDGVRRGGGRYPGSAFGSDFEAAIALIETLRQEKPDIYINLTTGTWPSPFWLLFADSIWRGGYDHEFAGVGSKRQQWITYRDAKTYENVVRGGPLFPISSLMLHGVIYAKKARGLNDDPENDLRDEIRSAFGCGTQLQELYVTPSLLTEENWDDLAAAASWARKKKYVLDDVHWVGGSPAALEVYGWAAWSPLRGALTLRNPSDKKQSFTLDLAKVLELPSRGTPVWILSSPYEDQRIQSLAVSLKKPETVELQPFEVLVYDIRPAK